MIPIILDQEVSGYYRLLDQKARESGVVVLIEGCPLVLRGKAVDSEGMSSEKLVPVLERFCREMSYKWEKAGNVYLLKKVYRAQDFPEVTLPELFTFVGQLNKDAFVKFSASGAKIDIINSLLSSLRPEDIGAIREKGYSVSLLSGIQKGNIRDLCYGYYLTDINTDLNWIRETKINLSSDKCMVNWTWIQNGENEALRTTTYIQSNDAVTVVRKTPIANSDSPKIERDAWVPDPKAPTKSVRALADEVVQRNPKVTIQVDALLEKRTVIALGDYLGNLESVLKGVSALENGRLSYMDETKDKRVYTLTHRPARALHNPSDYRDTLYGYIPYALACYFDDVLRGSEYLFEIMSLYGKMTVGLKKIFSGVPGFDKESILVTKLPMHYRNYLYALCCLSVAEKINVKARGAIPEILSRFDEIIMSVETQNRQGGNMTYFNLSLPNDEGRLSIISSHGSPRIKKAP